MKTSFIFILMILSMLIVTCKSDNISILVNEEKEMGLSKEFEMPMNATTKRENVDYGELLPIDYYSKATEETRSAFVILPAGYDKSQKYPVMYLLHGIGGTEREWFQGKPQEVIGNLIAEKTTKPFITVIPNVRARKDDYNTSDVFSMDNINAFNNFIYDLSSSLMPYIASNFSVSDKREDTAICGLSMGGMESLNIGFRMLDTFGWIGAFSPAPTLDTKLLVIDDSESEPSLVFICNGDSDSVVKKSPNEYHDVLTSRNIEHVWYEYPEGDHNFVVWTHGLYNFVKRVFK